MDKYLESDQLTWSRGTEAPPSAVPRISSNALATTIISLVARHQGTSPALLFAPTRCRAEVAYARQMAMYLLNVVAGLNMVEVGRLFGRDRSTVSHACALIEDRREDAHFDTEMSALEDEIETVMTVSNLRASAVEPLHASN